MVGNCREGRAIILTPMQRRISYTIDIAHKLGTQESAGEDTRASGGNDRKGGRLTTGGMPEKGCVASRALPDAGGEAVAQALQGKTWAGATG